MAQNFKPDGYTSVSPYFVITDAERLIDLLEKVFDGQLIRKYNRPDGSIMHAEVKIDDSTIMMGNSSTEYPPNQLLVHVYVEDVDSVFEKAILAGCESMERPAVKDGDPDKRGMFQDFGGNIWAVSTQLKEA